MHRLAIDIDTVAYVRNLLNGKEPDPVHALVMAEIGGAESIVCYLRDDLRTVNERDIAIFKQIVKTYLNIRTNLTEDNVHKLMRLKPDMVTFVAPGAAETTEPIAMDLNIYFSELQKYIAELRTNGILSSVLIEPEISQIKLAGKLEFDYVELSAKDLIEAEDMNSEVETIEQLSGISLAAGKLGIGVNISGNIRYDNVRDIKMIDNVEDIIIGTPIFNKALSIGYEQAVRDFISQL
jgi:pyridoxine 5-phosphate synthase